MFVPAAGVDRTESGAGASQRKDVFDVHALLLEVSAMRA